VARPQKAQQEEKPVHPIKKKVQEKERRLRRIEEEEAAHMAKLQETQQEWKRSPAAELRRRAEEHCGKGVLEEAHLLELEWCMEEVIVKYM